ncbi:MAG: DUF3857 and transglutaminase domain-containing protein [Kiritimatiellia bacterium]
MHLIRRTLTLTAWLAARALTADAEKLNPEAVPASMRAWITPAADALRAAGIPPPPGRPRDGEVLVFERLLRIEDDLSLVEVEHYMARALTEAGAESIRQDTHSYYRLNQELELAWGRVHAPDGGVKEAKTGEVIEITPSFDAEEAQYSDVAQLRVLLPDVKPGMVVETCWVKRHLRPRLPETLGFMMPWEAFDFSTVRMRLGVDASSAVAAGLKEGHLGAAPRRMESVLPDGRIRREWTVENLPPATCEVDEPPMRQKGPCTYLTTLRDWDHFAGIYNRVLEELPATGKDIREAAGRLAPPEAERTEVIRAAVAKVSDDIRYTGLEFGIAALRPHDANEVWRRGFGDCKDKSNLVRLLLRERGIPAWLVLLQTEAPGEVPAEVASHLVFNHAIVAIDDGRGGWIFADPTQKHLPAGRLPEWCGDRPVLLLEDGKARWLRTPAGEPARMAWTLDLTLEPDASMSGWMEKECRGPSAAQRQAWITSQTASSLREAFSGDARLLFPDAAMLDFEPCTFDATNLVHRARLFLSRPAQTAGDSGRYQVPLPAFLTPNLGERSERTQPFCLYGGDYHFTARIRCGNAWKPQALPGRFDLELPEMEAHGAVTAAGGVLTVSASMSPRALVIGPGRFAAVHQANDSFRHWLNQPVLLLRAEGAEPPATGGVARVEMPRMQTGQGQIDYIDTRWPESGNLARRREALETVRQWFPKDVEACYSVEVLLAGVELRENNPPAAGKRLQALLHNDSSQIQSAENTAWANYVLGLALERQGRKEEAMETFRNITGSTGVSEYRRAFATYKQAELRAPADPVEAAGLYREAALLDSGSQPELAADWIAYLARGNMTNELRLAAAELARGEEWILPEMLTHLDNQMAGGNDSGRKNLVDAFLPPDDVANPAVAAAWNTHRTGWEENLNRLDGLTTLREKLLALVRDTELPGKEKLWLSGRPLPPRAELVNSVRANGAQSAARLPFWSSLNAALLYPPDNDTCEMLIKVIEVGVAISARDFPEVRPFMAKLLRTIEAEPGIPGELLIQTTSELSDVLLNAGEMEASTAMLRRHIEGFKGSRGHLACLRGQLFHSLMREGRAEEAVEEADLLSPDLGLVVGCCRVALQVAAANAHLKKFGEARHWIDRARELAARDEVFLADESLREEFVAILKGMLSMRDGLDTFWKARPGILAQWEEFARANGLERPAGYSPGMVLELGPEDLMVNPGEGQTGNLNVVNKLIYGLPAFVPAKSPSLVSGLHALESIAPPLPRSDKLPLIRDAIVAGLKDLGGTMQPVTRGLLAINKRDPEMLRAVLPELASNLSSSPADNPAYEASLVALFVAYIPAGDLHGGRPAPSTGLDTTSWPASHRMLLGMISSMASRPLRRIAADRLDAPPAAGEAANARSWSRPKAWTGKHPFPWTVFEQKALGAFRAGNTGRKTPDPLASYLTDLRALTVTTADPKIRLEAQVEGMADALARYAHSRVSQAELDECLDSWSDPAAPLPGRILNRAAIRLLELSAESGQRDAVIALAGRADRVPDRDIRNAVTTLARWWEQGKAPAPDDIDNLLQPPVKRERVAVVFSRMNDMFRRGDHADFYENLARMSQLKESAFCRPNLWVERARLCKQDDARIKLLLGAAEKSLGPMSDRRPDWMTERGLLDSVRPEMFTRMRRRAECGWWKLGSGRTSFYSPDLVLLSARDSFPGTEPEAWVKLVANAVELAPDAKVSWTMFTEALGTLDPDVPESAATIPEWMALGAKIATDRAQHAFLNSCRPIPTSGWAGRCPFHGRGRWTPFSPPPRSPVTWRRAGPI